MKKVGIVIFVVALVAGVLLANMSQFGKFGIKVFSVPMNFGAVSGSGNVVKETRDITDFKSLDVGGVFRVEVTEQKDYRVEIESDDNLLPLIRTEVRGSTLHIEADSRLRSNSPIVIRVAAPDIDSIDSSGAANIAIVNVKNTRLGVESSGASKISVQGETSVLTIGASGASHVDADALNAETAKVDASGASVVNVNVRNELNACSSGASKILYTGSARVVKNTSGGSSVTQK